MNVTLKNQGNFSINIAVRIIVVAAISLVLVLALNRNILLAIEDPDTDKCAQCHRSHTSISEHLITPTYQNAQCLTCHNGTGSIINVAEDFASANHHSLGGFDTGSEKQCATCHESHIHISGEINHLTDSRNIRDSWAVVNPDDSRYDNQTPPSGIYLWCERCHADSEQTPIGTTILTAQTTETAYIPYDVQVAFQTSYSQVDDNGDTSTAGYWQYFTSETIGDRYGYNDEQATGQSSHGRASLSADASSNIGLWKGSYGPDSPALPCTKCHASHGSIQPWMIVDSISASTDDTVTAGYDMTTVEGQRSFCESCHVGTYGSCSITEKCTNCHRHGSRF